MKIIEFYIETPFEERKFSIKTLLEEINSKITDKNENEFRENKKKHIAAFLFYRDSAVKIKFYGFLLCSLLYENNDSLEKFFPGNFQACSFGDLRN